MNCPTHHQKCQTIESRPRHGNTTYRRYQCPKGCYFSTTEAVNVKTPKAIAAPKVKPIVHTVPHIAHRPNINPRSVGANVLLMMLT